MKKYALLILILILLSGCSYSPDKKIPLSWTWEEDQGCANAKNIWGGFVPLKEGFKAKKPISAFAFWRKTPSNKVVIIYRSKSHFPVKIAINGKITASLPYSQGFKRVVLPTSLLRRGINIISFFRRNRKEFTVKSICLEGGRGKNFVLEKGERLLVPMNAGRFEISFRGRGKLRLRIYQGSDFSPSSERTAKRPIGLFPINLSLTSPEPFLLEAETIRGSFVISSFKYEEKHEKLPEPPPLKFKKPYPDIFIFLIDACQASHLSLYGYRRKTSPNIEKLAEDSLVFENAYTTAGFTRATVASIFSGLFPEHHKVRVLRAALDRRLLLLPEYLKTKGYRTSIFTASANVSAAFGFSQGVDDYFGYYGRWEARMERSMPRDFLRWLSLQPSPRFSYLHFMEPHFPIIPPPPFRNMFKTKVRKNPVILRIRKMKNFTPEDVQDVVDDYDSTIAYIDSVLGKIWDRMRRMGVYENSMIIFLSDHGEALYEHGAFGHGPIVYEEMTHIPLVVKFPSYLKLKGRVKALVQVTDIFPTIAELFGDELKLDGRSLLQAYAQGKQGNEITVSRNFLNPGTYGIRWKEYYYIINMGNFEEELFDLKKNPRREISHEKKPVVFYLRGRFLEWLRKYQNLSLVERKIKFKKLSKRELENLRSLGYIK